MPAATSSTEPSSTGASAKCRSCTPDSTTNNALAPPGGCRQRSRNIAPMARPTTEPATHGSTPKACTQRMPTSADTVLPPITAQGCAIGLAGTPKTSTALARIDGHARRQEVAQPGACAFARGQCEGA